MFGISADFKVEMLRLRLLLLPTKHNNILYICLKFFLSWSTPTASSPLGRLPPPLRSRETNGQTYESVDASIAPEE